jgi:ribonuclease E
MSSKMLIDAAHPEETRVVVVRGNRVEDFDYESANRKQLRGNIYLAKVTRVEPSLQAAFVDYGGNRHGFLAFSEIHPDYYQIPVADRQALLEEEAEEESKAEAKSAADDAGKAPADTKPDKAKADIALEAADAVSAIVEDVEPGDEGQASKDAESGSDTPADQSETADEAEASDLRDSPWPVGLVEDQGVVDVNGQDQNGEAVNVEDVGSEDALEALPERTRRRRRDYKIQEVIKRRQIILVQVVKEERGNKGAALTTYLSLAGRFTVLMPNTARGGGISRKITNVSDRKRLRKIVGELDVTGGMGLIVRTAGASRTKAEIKRDYEYLLRLWENIRDLTLSSTAPSLVYEEGNLIKRSIRDLYNKDIDEILVAGDEAYRDAKEFMRMLMPSHAKNVRPYKDPAPIFTSNQIEPQLAAMFNPTVTLKSGGYIVINQTEALVSIDVNSGKSTREHNIEDTALATNLEAVEEVSRQLRLRDLAGLLVIDFIDMEERRNNRSVERRLKDCLRSDRARIQVGRISHFGLLEMSRQRLRTGVLEGSTAPCSHCLGTGVVRSTESVALDLLRMLEDTLLRDGAANLSATASVEAAVYVLNQKRLSVKDIEERYNVSINIEADPNLHGANFSIARAPTGEDADEGETVVQMDWSKRAAETERAEGDQGDGRKRSRRKRRRKRTRPDRGEAVAASGVEAAEQEDQAPVEAVGGEDLSDEAEAAPKKSRRRGRRGGRRSRGSGARAAAKAEQSTETPAETSPEASSEADPAPAAEAAAQPDPEAAPAPAVEIQAESESVDKPAPKKRTAKRGTTAKKPRARKPRAKTAEGASKSKSSDPSPAVDDSAGGANLDAVATSKQADTPQVPAPETAKSAEQPDDADGQRESRSGWWQRGA